MCKKTQNLMTTLINVNFSTSVITVNGDHPVYAGSCETQKVEKEILAINHRDNISNQKARKMVAGYKTVIFFYRYSTFSFCDIKLSTFVMIQNYPGNQWNHCSPDFQLGLAS